MKSRTLANPQTISFLGILFSMGLCFSASVKAAKNEPIWSDEGGWDDLTNFSTIQAVGVSDDLYLLARGNAGMTTLRYKFITDSWMPVATNNPKWSDANGWDDLSNYSTIQAVGVSNELYLLARSNFGVITRHYDKSTDRWKNLAGNDLPWSNTDDWNKLSNYSTIQALGVGNDLYLLGRSKSGMNTLRYNKKSDKWDEVASNDPAWSDSNGWDDLSNSDTIQAVSAGQDLYLIARANSGIISLRFNREADLWEPIASNNPSWSDKNGWSDLSNYSTIQAVESDGQLYLLARGNSGMITLKYSATSDSWETLSPNYPRWSDKSGWSDFTNYSTIQAVSAGDDMYLLARTNYGITTRRLNKEANRWESIASNDPTWSDAAGWNDFSKYSTIQAVASNGKLFLFARDQHGMITMSYDPASDEWVTTSKVETKR